MNIIHKICAAFIMFSITFFIGTGSVFAELSGEDVGTAKLIRPLSNEELQKFFTPPKGKEIIFRGTHAELPSGTSRNEDTKLTLSWQWDKQYFEIEHQSGGNGGAITVKGEQVHIDWDWTKAWKPYFAKVKDTWLVVMTRLEPNRNPALGYNFVTINGKKMSIKDAFGL